MSQALIGTRENNERQHLSIPLDDWLAEAGRSGQYNRRRASSVSARVLVHRRADRGRRDLLRGSKEAGSLTQVLNMFTSLDRAMAEVEVLRDMQAILVNELSAVKAEQAAVRRLAHDALDSAGAPMGLELRDDRSIVERIVFLGKKLKSS